MSLIINPRVNRNTIEPQHSKELDNSEEKDECCICLDEMSKNGVLTLDCGHTFHINCFMELIKTTAGKRCPLCRSDHGVDRGRLVPPGAVVRNQGNRLWPPLDPPQPPAPLRPLQEMGWLVDRNQLLVDVHNGLWGQNFLGCHAFTRKVREVVGRICRRRVRTVREVYVEMITEVSNASLAKVRVELNKMVTNGMMVRWKQGNAYVYFLNY